jgi:hypothetical protein
MDRPIMHVTRGVLAVGSTDEARAMHNAFVTGGEPSGMEIARSLGDLSHNVFMPPASGDTAAAMAGGLVFIDQWADPGGMEEFFANPLAQAAGDGLYGSREEAEWVPAPGAFGFHVFPPADAAPRLMWLMRAPVDSADEAITQLGKLAWTRLARARRRGQLSHALYVRSADLKTARPASNSQRDAGKSIAEAPHPTEVLAIDSWTTLEGLREHYDDPMSMSGLDAVLAGPPDASVWEQASGFREW